MSSGPVSREDSLGKRRRLGGTADSIVGATWLSRRYVSVRVGRGVRRVHDKSTNRSRWGMCSRREGYQSLEGPWSRVFN